jgi:hypothetical protein
MEFFHACLNLVGTIPFVGAAADVANAALYVSEGRYGMAALSAATAIPFAGLIAVGAKMGLRSAGHAAEELAEAGARELETGVRAERRIIDEVPSGAGPGAAAGARRAIGATGEVGEEALRSLGGESQVFFRTSRGGRYVDQLVGGVAHESKVGYTTLTRSISNQISKDAELIATRQIQGSTWHFFGSPATGLGGPSGPLRAALEQAGISIVVH